MQVETEWEALAIKLKQENSMIRKNFDDVCMLSTGLDTYTHD